MSPPGLNSKNEADLYEQPTSVSDASTYDERATKRLLRKLDWHLIPFLALLYLFSFLDRSNIGNAKLAGLEESLHLTGLDYNNALAIFFPFYVAAEIPSNLLMKATRPSLWIPFIMICWGTMCVLMGIVKNYAGLMAIRSALGLSEGGLFPGVTFFITMWYRRHECGFRMAMFFSAATASGAFSGLLARAIMLMDGDAGLRSWQWIFILEGIATFLVGIIAFFVLHDYPDTAKFLSDHERQEVRRRLESDRSSLADEFRMQYVWDALRDWKIWVFCVMQVGIFTPLYSFSLFLPTIIKDLGYENNEAQLMTVPPYVVACVFCIGCGFVADRTQQRGVYQIFFSLVAMFGFVALLTSDSTQVKYGGTFMAAVGVYSNVANCTAWNANTIGGATKRSVGMAMQVGAGNLGGVISAYLFLAKDAPHYKPGHSALIGFCAMACVLSVFMTFYLRMENRRRDQKYKAPGKYTAEERAMERTKGDKASFFRYVY